MQDSIFNDNVLWNIKQIAIQVRHANDVKGRARSGYYKAAIMIAASVAEALSFKVLENHNHLAMPHEDWQCTRSQPLSNNFVSKNGSTLSICERIRPVFKLTAKTDFKKVDEVCLKLNIFTPLFFNKIEKIRTLRNKIHIQGLSDTDRSYTKRELESVGSVIVSLLDLL